ncbi:MAG: hypothetical protein PHG05_03785 [Candidatus Nanoarchaeia archaeon]|nr:hypothetical protein [Candidatus Nanoarchaeia archaeon]
MAEGDIEYRYVAEEARSRMVGVLELSEFYKALKRWCDFEGFSDGSSGGGKLFNEIMYKHIDKGGGVANVDIVWEVRKPSGSPYITYYIKIIWLLIGISKVEVVADGKKVKRDKGDFEIRMSARLEKDFKKMKGGFFGLKSLKRTWEKFLMKDEIEDHEEELRRKFMSLQKFVRDWFEQHIQSPTGYPFETPSSFPSA